MYRISRQAALLALAIGGAACTAVLEPTGPALQTAAAPVIMPGPAAIGRADGRPSPYAGATRFAGSCGALWIGEVDLTRACGDRFSFEFLPQGRVVARLALSSGTDLLFEGPDLTRLGPDTDAFSVERITLPQGTVAGPFVGACSYTQPRRTPFVLRCLAISESGLSIEAEFQGQVSEL